MYLFSEKYKVNCEKQIYGAGVPICTESIKLQNKKIKKLVKNLNLHFLMINKDLQKLTKLSNDDIYQRKENLVIH